MDYIYVSPIYIFNIFQNLSLSLSLLLYFGSDPIHTLLATRERRTHGKKAKNLPELLSHTSTLLIKVKRTAVVAECECVVFCAAAAAAVVVS